MTNEQCKLHKINDNKKVIKRMDPPSSCTQSSYYLLYHNLKCTNLARLVIRNSEAEGCFGTRQYVIHSHFYRQLQRGEHTLRHRTKKNMTKNIGSLMCIPNVNTLVCILVQLSFSTDIGGTVKFNFSNIKVCTSLTDNISVTGIKSCYLEWNWISERDSNNKKKKINEEDADILLIIQDIKIVQTYWIENPTKLKPRKPTQQTHIRIMLTKNTSFSPHGL